MTTCAKKKKLKGGHLFMLLESINIDVQIHQEEIKKPESHSLILVPLKSKKTVTNQLVMHISNIDRVIKPKHVDDAARVVFREWKTIFPLYEVERAFANISEDGSVDVYATFDAANIFSNTQLRNIQKTITELLESELTKALATNAKREEALLRKTTDSSDFDFRSRLDELKKETTDLQSALEKNRLGEKVYQENVDALSSELDRQQYAFNQLPKHTNTSAPLYQQVQEGIDDTSLRLRQSQQELLDKHREIQRLQTVVTENERYIARLQGDYDQLKEMSDHQTHATLSENESLKQEVSELKQLELTHRQEIQTLQAEMNRTSSDKENIKEELIHQLQRIKFENDELRLIINENQTFEERTHQELIEATKQVKELTELVGRLESEKDLLEQEWTVRYETVSMEKNELALAYKSSQELELATGDELIELKQHVIHLEQKVQQAALDKQQFETTWQTRLMAEEREKERLIQQITLDKEQFVHNKEQEIKRLSERLLQQKELVDKLMANQSDTQTVWKENNETLELSFQQAKQQTAELEMEVSRLTQENRLLASKLAQLSQEPALSVAAPLEDNLDQVIEKEVAELEEAIVPVVEASEKTEEYSDYAEEEEVVSEEESDYGYDEDEYDYDYDSDYDYHEVDDLINYNPETIEDDVEEFLDNKDEEGKEKISKKDYALYELYLEHLPELVEQGKELPFNSFVEPKMKKFKKFSRDLEDDVKTPSLFSRKYKVPTGLANQMKAYVLMSRHLSILLGVDVEEDEYYGYEYDYEYDYDYDSDDYYESK